MPGFRLRPKNLSESVDNFGIAVGGFGDAVGMICGMEAYRILSDLNEQTAHALRVPLVLYEAYLLTDILVRYKTGEGLSERAYEKLQDFTSAARKGGAAFVAGLRK